MGAIGIGRAGSGSVGVGCTFDQEGYSGVVLKAWSVKVVVMVCSGGSGAPSPLRLDSASRMVGRRFACRDASRLARTSLNPRERRVTADLADRGARHRRAPGVRLLVWWQFPRALGVEGSAGP